MATVIHKSGNFGGFTHINELVKHLVEELTVDGHFKRVFPNSVTPVTGNGTIILEPTALVDSLREKQDTWRIALSTPETPPTANGGSLELNVATKLQLKDDGTIARVSGSWEANSTPGRIANWLDRSKITGEDAPAVYPMSYCYTISDHGIFIGVWDQAFDEYQDESKHVSPNFRWIVIQRPVDNKTGEAHVGGRAPVFCVYTVAGKGMIHAGPEYLPHDNLGVWSETLSDTRKAEILAKAKAAQIVQGDFKHFLRPVDLAQFHFKFVVCEADVQRPTLTRPADVAMPDSNPILNSSEMVSVSEDNKYVITIPKGLNTPRFAYTQELDLIAYTSADVIGQFTEVDLPLYGTDYRYKALPASRLKNTGMRILCRIADPVAVPPEGDEGVDEGVGG